MIALYSLLTAFFFSREGLFPPIWQLCAAFRGVRGADMKLAPSLNYKIIFQTHLVPGRYIAPLFLASLACYPDARRILWHHWLKPQAFPDTRRALSHLRLTR